MFITEKKDKDFFSFLNKYMLHIFFHAMIVSLVIDLSSPVPSTTFQHLIITMFFLVVVFTKKKPVHDIGYHPVMIGFICCLVYGISVALYFHNNLYFVFRNAFGIFNYFLLFVSLSFFSRNEIFKVLLSTSLISNVVIFAMAFFKGYLSTDHLGESRFIYSPLIYFCFVGFLYPLDKLYRGSDNVLDIYFWLINFAFVALTSLVLSLSKGAIIGALAIVSIYFLLNLNKSFKKTLSFLLLASPILFFSMYKLKLFDLMYSFFSNASGPTADSRFLQNKYLWEETSFFGSGFGSYLQNGFLRDPVFKYSYEATFFNYVNKLGIVSLILWSIYIYTFYLIVKAFRKEDQNKFAILALSSTIFLFMGLGNPSLFSPCSVLLHVCILFMVNDKDEIDGELVEARMVN